MTIVHYLASTFWGGGEQYVFTLSQYLKENMHHKVVFICQPDTQPLVIKRLSDIGTTYIIHPTTKNGKFSFISAWQLARICHKEHASVIHVHALKDYFVAVYAKLLCMCGIRLVATCHYLSPAKNKCTWRWAYRHIDSLICVSQLAKSVFVSHPQVQRAFRRVVVIPNSVAIAPTTNDETFPNLRRDYQIDTATRIISFHGRIGEEKGIVQLIEHLQPICHLPFVLVLLGEVTSTMQSRLDALRAMPEWKNRILCLGFYQHPLPIVRQADLAVVPSIVAECGSLSLLENMAVGLPTIASNNGSEPEFITHDQEGLLCEPTRYDQWCEAISLLVTNDKKRRDMGFNAKQRFEHIFDYPAFVQQIIHQYE